MWGESPDWFQRRCCWTPATSDWTYYWWHDPSCYHMWSCQGDEMSCSRHHSPVNQNRGAWPQNMNTNMSNEDLCGFVEVYVGLCLPINVLEYHRACVQCIADLIWKKGWYKMSLKSLETEIAFFCTMDHQNARERQARLWANMDLVKSHKDRAPNITWKLLRSQMSIRDSQ